MCPLTTTARLLSFYPREFFIAIMLSPLYSNHSRRDGRPAFHFIPTKSCVFFLHSFPLAARGSKGVDDTN